MSAVLKPDRHSPESGNPVAFERVPLGQALPIKYGKSKSDAYGEPADDVPVYGSSGQIGNFSRRLTSGPTLIVGRKGSAGSVHYSTGPCWPIDTVYYAEEKPGTHLPFFRYLLESLRLVQFDRSTAIPSLSRDDYNAIEVSIPEEVEQRRIVAELETQLTRLDASVTALKRVRANLKRYRASVLKAACEGYPVVELGSLIGEISQGWSPRCDLDREPLANEWAVIKTTAVQPMKYISSECKPLPSALLPRPHIEIRKGDFLMTRKGPRERAGITCLVRETRPYSMVCDTVYRFQCDASKVVPAYLEIALNSTGVVHALDRLKAGINDSGVSLTHQKVRGVAVSLPQQSEQHRIVADVERRLSVITELEATVTANLKRAERLRQSVLAAAFSW